MREPILSVKATWWLCAIVFVLLVIIKIMGG